MGGRGSGSSPDIGNWRGGRAKKTAIQVVGTGSPDMPDDLPSEVRAHWLRLTEMTSGVSFSQDSDAVAELAWLMWMQDRYRVAIKETPLDADLVRISLHIGRSVRELLVHFGLTPCSRQVLLVAKEEREELDPLDALNAE